MSHNADCSKVGLPTPLPLTNSEENLGEVVSDTGCFHAMYIGATDEQKRIVEEVIGMISIQASIATRIFYLEAPAACGMTYVQQMLRCYMNSQNRRCIVACYTGIAASIIKGGLTLHNVFKLPVPLSETSLSDTDYQSAHAEWLRNCELLIIDEASMVPSLVLTIIDRLMRDIKQKSLPFGGIVVLFSGDFRQTLPVVPHGGRALTVEESIKRNHLWKQVRQFKLSKNMRYSEGEDDFAAHLIKVGDGCLPEGDTNVTLSSTLHQHLTGTGCPIDLVYKNIQDRIHLEDVNSAILAPRNIDYTDINDKVLERLSGKGETCFSTDVVCSDETCDHLNFPTEFLNSIEMSGLPKHKLDLKKDAVVMLMQNLHTARGLINGTRMQAVDMLHHSVECKVLTGAAKGERVLIPRIKWSSSAGVLPFKFSRTQIPVTVAFAITINKSQGQSLSKVGIYLKNR